jgi:hypothetical protein
VISPLVNSFSYNFIGAIFGGKHKITSINILKKSIKCSFEEKTYKNIS